MKLERYTEIRKYGNASIPKDCMISYQSENVTHEKKEYNIIY